MDQCEVDRDMESALHRRTKTGKIPKRGPHQGIPFASASILNAIPIGCSMVLREPDSAMGIPGSNAQSFASRVEAKFSTAKCYVVIPGSNEMVIAVLVTRVG